LRLLVALLALGACSASPRPAPTKAGMHYIIVFKSKLRDGVEADYGTRAEAIYNLATGMPGLISAEDYKAESGERVSIIEWDTMEHLIAWRDHPEHLKAQQEGRDKYYASYSISIAQVQRSSAYDATTKQWTKKP
jgi:heme-degrading monooxygenase HmoA